MRAGQLRHIITINSKTVTQDSYNAETITWSTVATLRAQIETTGGSEYSDVEAQGASLTHKITIRYYPDLAPTMIVVWGTRTFQIDAVMNDNLQRETVLMCSEAVTA